MSSEQERACKNPIEDQRKQALAHYEEASSAIRHWSSFVANAIKAYNPDSGEQQPVTGELYWKRRCLASEEIYRLLNLGLVHSKEYLVWEKLKNQEVEPGQQNQDELLCDRLFIEYGNDKDAVTDFGDKAIIDWLISKYLLIKKDKP